MDNRHLCRGKRLDNGEWAYGCRTIGGDGTTLIDEINSLGLFEESHEVDPDTVSQCTGLAAANSYRGTESEDVLIFQKDVVREIGGAMYHIDYLKQTIVARKIGTVSRFKWIEELITDNIEIIGNSIDNPELLEVDGE